MKKKISYFILKFMISMSVLFIESEEKEILKIEQQHDEEENEEEEVA